MGALCTPGTMVLSRLPYARRPASAASQRQSLTSARYRIPSTRTFKMTRHQPRVHSRSPARPSPSPVAPGRNEDPSAYTPGSAPRSHPQRTPGRGPAFEHGPEITSPSAPPPRDPLTACDLVSHAYRLTVHHDREWFGGILVGLSHRVLTCGVLTCGVLTCGVLACGDVGEQPGADHRVHLVGVGAGHHSPDGGLRWWVAASAVEPGENLGGHVAGPAGDRGERS